MQTKKVLVVDNAEPEDSGFNLPLLKFIAGLGDCDIINYTQMPSYRTIRTKYRAVILSGVPIHYDYECLNKRLGLFEWITRSHMPTLGICLGHQMIGRLFGGTLVIDKQPEVGHKRARIVQDDPLFCGLPPGNKFYMMHRASVTLPNDFVLLASTNDCANAVMRHKTKNIYGLQFHPELSPVGTTVIRNFIDKVSSRQSLPAADIGDSVGSDIPELV